MTVKTPAELKTLYESISFDLQTTYTGPLGQEYAVSGTHLRLWAPTAQRVEVSLYRKGSGGEPIGTLPLERGSRGCGASICPATSTDDTIPIRSQWMAFRARPATPTPALPV